MKILQNYFMRFSLFLNRIALTGVTEEANYLLRKEIKMVNVIALSTASVSFIYGVVNILKLPIISVINFVCVALILYAFKLNKQQRYQAAKSWMLVVFMCFLVVVNLLAPNVAEYYLIIVLTIGQLIFKNKTTKISILILVALAVLIPKFYPYDLPFISEVAKERLLINSVLGLLFLSALVIYHQTIQDKYQEYIKEQSLKIVELNNDLKHLLAVIAHDIHSPLQTTSTMVQLISEEKIDPQSKEETLRLINKQLKTLRSNLDNLLDWSRINLGGIETQKAHILLREIMNDAIESFAARTSEKNINMTSQIDSTASIDADPVQISVIFRNLLDNAIKFSNPGGSIAISAKTERDYIEIRVSDHGKGMNDEQINHLFEGTREPAYGTLGEKGTGLGLLLVQKLVTANSGQIKVESKEEQGTLFRIQFPKPKLV